MVANGLLDAGRKGRRKRAKILTGRKFAEGMGAAASVGLAAGIFFTLKAGKKTREELKKSANTVTIEVHDLNKLKIERIE